MSVNYNVLKLMTNVFFFFSFLGKVDLIDLISSIVLHATKYAMHSLC